MTDKELEKLMTDEEMAKEYARENEEVYGSDEYADITDYNNIKEAFLAGLKAGKDMNVPIKWHKVADGDYPKPNIAVLICLQFEKRTTTYIAYYRPAMEKWQIYNLLEAQREPIEADYIDTNEVIAWCEIPKYTKE